MYTHSWFTLLYRRNEHNTVNSYTPIKKEKKPVIKHLLCTGLSVIISTSPNYYNKLHLIFTTISSASLYHSSIQQLKIVVCVYSYLHSAWQKQKRGEGKKVSITTQRISYCHFLFIHLFRQCHVACRISVPWPQIELEPKQWKPRTLTPRLPGNSP